MLVEVVVVGLVLVEVAVVVLEVLVVVVLAGVWLGSTRFVLRGQKMGCHSGTGSAQPPSNHAGGGERERELET